MVTEDQNYFPDSRKYDLGMGRLSRFAGEAFLDWLSLPPGLRLLDVGCGTGTFTELLLSRSEARALSAIDPSEGQIAFAKSKPWADAVDLRVGDGMAMPYGEDAFDAAVMALVIQYIPDPAKAMAEIKRAVRPGGTVAAYVWPARGDGHPMEPLYDAITSIGASVPERPGTDIRTIGGLVDVFEASGLAEIDSRSIDVRFEFASLEDYWDSQSGAFIKNMTDHDIERLKQAISERLPEDENGRVTFLGRANAVRGCVPD